MRTSRTFFAKILSLLAAGALACPISACSSLDSSNEPQADAQDERHFESISDRLSEEDPETAAEADGATTQKQDPPSADELRESPGIELVHVGGKDGYPEEQLQTLDKLIAYIDAYYGFESRIIDHKAWRSGNSDTSPEFAAYLDSYQSTRTHDGS